MSTPERRKYEREYWARNKERKREIDRRYRAKHKERLAAELRAWRDANPEKYKAQHARSYVSPARPKWLSENKEQLRAWRSARFQRLLAEDEQFALRVRLRSRFNGAFKKGARSPYLEHLVGCSYADLVAHLERQFKPGMTWENYGRKGWHIDHIIPLLAFDFTDPEQDRVAYHYTNLQPLWAAENIKKSHRERRIYGV